MLLLDTHVLVWLAADEARLGKRTARAIDRALASTGVAVSAFSFWEIATLVERGRLRGLDDAGELRAKALGAGVVEVAVDGEIALLAARLRSFHGDPADRVIVATATHQQAALVTADEKLLAWKHGPKVIDATR